MRFKLFAFRYSLKLKIRVYKAYKHSTYVTENSILRLMMFRGKIDNCSVYGTEHMNTFFGQHTEIFFVLKQLVHTVTTMSEGVNRRCEQ